MHPYNERENTWLSAYAQALPPNLLDVSTIEAAARAHRARVVGDAIGALVRSCADRLRLLGRVLAKHATAKAPPAKARMSKALGSLPRAKA